MRSTQPAQTTLIPAMPLARLTQASENGTRMTDSRYLACANTLPSATSTSPSAAHTSSSAPPTFTIASLHQCSPLTLSFSMTTTLRPLAVLLEALRLPSWPIREWCRWVQQPHQDRQLPRESYPVAQPPPLAIPREVVFLPSQSTASPQVALSEVSLSWLSSPSSAYAAVGAEG